MKIVEGFVLRQVAGQHVVVAIGNATKLLNGMIELNATGAFLWTALMEGASKADLIAKLQAEYAIDAATAEADVTAFLNTLERVGCIAE